MLISHEHKFIFVHVYKNAGSAISACLEPWAGHSLHDLPYHLTACEIRNQIGSSDYPLLNANLRAWSEYFSFAVVRNPWDWMVSLYHWLCQQPAHDLCEFARELDGFREFVAWLHDPQSTQPPSRNGGFGEYRRPQTSFICDDKGDVIVNHVIRYETLDAEFAEICQRFNISARRLRTNTSTHPPYRKCYEQLTRNRIADLFRTDLDLFGYDF